MEDYSINGNPWDRIPIHHEFLMNMPNQDICKCQLDDEGKLLKKVTQGCELCIGSGFAYAGALMGSMLHNLVNVNINHYKFKTPKNRSKKQVLADSDAGITVVAGDQYTVPLTPGSIINGPAYGPHPSELMIIGDAIDKASAHTQYPKHFHIPKGSNFQSPGTVIDRVFREKLNMSFEEYGDCYYTSCLKFLPPGRTAGDTPKKYYQYFRAMLAYEIALVKPKVILLMGATATKMIMSNKAKVSTMSGALLRLPSFDMLDSVLPSFDEVDEQGNLVAPNGPIVIPTVSVRAMVMNSFNENELGRHLSNAISIVKSGPQKVEEADNYRYYTELDEVLSFVKEMKDGGYTKFAVDCEWGGKCWFDGHLRSIQISWGAKEAAVITFYKDCEDSKDRDGAATSIAPSNYDSYLRPIYDPNTNHGLVCNALKEILAQPTTKLMGHSLRSDLIWMIHHLFLDGCQDLAYFDTMLAHHVLNCTLPHDLTYCTTEYTDMGVYDLELKAYLSANGLNEKVLSKHSYGMIPYEMLKVYSAKDVDATFRLYEQLKPKIEADDGYKSVFYDVVMPVTPAILEMEIKGLYTDVERLEVIIEQYRVATDSVLERLRGALGNADFNPRSPIQVRKVLFGTFELAESRIAQFGLSPVKSTGTDSQFWDEVMESKYYEEDKSYLEQTAFSASTDAETVDVLVTEATTSYTDAMKKQDTEITADQKEHVISILKDLSAFKLLDQMRKNFTAPKNEAGEYDKGLMKFLSPYKSIATNIGQMTDTGRYTSAKPNLQNLPKVKEYALMESIKSVTGEAVSALRSVFIPRPGKILIEVDYSTAEVFVLAYLSKDKVLEEDAGKDIHSRNAVAILGADKYPGYDEGLKPDEEWKSEFGNIRSAAKSITFGIPYGKGPASMSREIQAAGLACTPDQAAKYIKAWKDKYLLAAAYLADCMGTATGGDWEVRTPFGRRRRFPRTEDSKKLAAYGREACNMPIQGTVGDILSLALIALYNYRRDTSTCPHIDVLLVVHDAILAECFPQDKDEVIRILALCMGQLAKIPGTDHYLEVDADVFERWCEHPSEAFLKSLEMKGVMA